MINLNFLMGIFDLTNQNLLHGMHKFLTNACCIAHAFALMTRAVRFWRVKSNRGLERCLSSHKERTVNSLQRTCLEFCKGYCSWDFDLLEDCTKKQKQWKQTHYNQPNLTKCLYMFIILRNLFKCSLAYNSNTEIIALLVNICRDQLLFTYLFTMSWWQS